MAIDVKKLYLVSKCVLINENNEFLIMKRTHYKNDNSGDFWDIPGGSVDEGEDINDAIVREIREEVGIEVKERLKILKMNSSKGKNESYGIFVLYYLENFDMSQEIVLSEEHSEFKWIGFEDIENYEFYSKKTTMDSIREFLENNC